MSTKFVDKGNSTVEVTVAIEEKVWKENQEKALNKLVKNVSIKGFRKGCAPVEMAKKQVNPADLLNEAINISLQNLYVEAIEENKINPYGNPEVNVTKVTDTELEVVFTITTMPKITLGAYKGLDVKAGTIRVTKDEVAQSIEHLLSENADLVLKEGAAEKGDTVVLDFKGYVNGQEFEGGSAENFELTLGSGQFVPGFEDQLIGCEPESKKDVIVTFPKQYVKDLAGKEAKFVCTIHEVKTKQTPELNDEFVTGLGIEGVATVADLEKHQKEQIKAKKNQEENGRVFDEILDKIIETSTIDLSDKIVATEANSIRDNFKQQIAQNGLTEEQYFEITGATEEKLMEQFKAQADKNLRGYLVLNTIGAQEKLTVSDEDLEEYYNTVAKQYGITADQVKEAFKANIENVKANLLQNKIFKFVLENNIAKKETAKEDK